MMAAESQVSAYREVDTKQAGAKRRRWPLEVKRQLVAETLERTRRAVGSWRWPVPLALGMGASRLTRQPSCSWSCRCNHPLHKR